MLQKRRRAPVLALLVRMEALRLPPLVHLRPLDGRHERVRHRSEFLLVAAAAPLGRRKPVQQYPHGAVVKPEQRLGCSGRRRRKDLDVVWGCSEKKKIVMVCAAAKGFRVF